MRITSWLLVVMLVAAMLIYVLLPLFGVAFFDSQCKPRGGCGNQACGTWVEEFGIDVCEATPESVCYQNCSARGVVCGYDSILADICLSCMNDCQKNASVTSDECARRCDPVSRT